MKLDIYKSRQQHQDGTLSGEFVGIVYGDGPKVVRVSCEEKKELARMIGDEILKILEAS